MENEKTMIENNLKGIELEKAGEVEEAIKLYEYNIAAGFDGNAPYDSLIKIYDKRKDYANEMRVLDRAIEIFEGIPDSRPDKERKLNRFKDQREKLKAKEARK